MHRLKYIYDLDISLIQQYVIKFVSDLRHICGFSPGPPVSSTNKTNRLNMTEILLRVALNTINQTKPNHIDVIFNCNVLQVKS